MKELSLLEIALIGGYRYPTGGATLHVTTEELYMLPVESPKKEQLCLTKIASEINRQIKDCGDTFSLLGDESPRSKIRDTLENMMEIVKGVANYRVEEAKRKREEKEIDSHNKHIDSLIAKKKLDNLGELSVEELENMKK